MRYWSLTADHGMNDLFLLMIEGRVANLDENNLSGKTIDVALFVAGG